MSVNDLIVQGAEPLYFLDYFACSKLKVDDAASVIKGIAEGCKQAQCALIGGETAEMPGIYQGSEYDLAGFAVGAVEREEILPKPTIKEGDALIGISSSGIHSNGYSLVHKVIAKSLGEVNYNNVKAPFGTRSLAEELLTPTKIYVKSTLPAIKTGLVKGMSHITGGGFIENIPRVLPNGLGATIDASKWVRPEVFNWLQREGNISSKEMSRTFNNGIGMIMVVDANDAQKVLETIKQTGEQNVNIIGQVVKSDKIDVINVQNWEN